MRLLISMLVIALALLQYRLWLSEDGLRQVWALQAQVTRQTEDNGAMADRNAALDAEVRDLKQGLAAAEERARAELGLVGAEETFFQVVPRLPE